MPDGIGYRYTVPLDDLHAFDELVVFHEFGNHLRHDEARCNVGTELFDEKGQPRRRAGERRRSDVCGVRISQVGQDAGDLAVERVVRHQPRPVVQPPELLHRIDAVHRPLQRKVDVQAVEQIGEHRDDVGAFGLGQRISRWRRGLRLGPAEPDEGAVHARTALSAKS